jgi:hypothetical protein
VHGGFVGYATVDGQQIRDQTVLAPDLYPGIWEVNVAASRTAADASAYEVSVAFDGYEVEPEAIVSLPHQATGKPAKGSVQVTRVFPGVFRGSSRASIAGFHRTEAVTVEDTDLWTHSFALDSQTPRAEFHLVMDEAVGNLFTDCAVNIRDASGQTVVATGFSGLEVTARVRLPAGQESASYTLEVAGGFALAPDLDEWGFDLEEKYFLAEPVAGEVKREGGGALAFYSGVPTDVKITFAHDWPESPAGLQPFGAVQFLDRNLPDKAPGDQGGRLVLEVPIALE